jgi:hypothetical protein
MKGKINTLKNRVIPQDELFCYNTYFAGRATSMDSIILAPRVEALPKPLSFLRYFKFCYNTERYTEINPKDIKTTITQKV